MTNKIRKQTNVAMILGDGGIKAGFIAGAADEILKGSKEVAQNLDTLVGVSASVGNVIYYLAMGDEHPGREMWTTLLTDKRFMHFRDVRDLYRNRPLYDLEYMVETIFRKENPIDQEKVKSHRITCYLPVQEAATGQITYFTNGESREFPRGKETVKIQNFGGSDLYKVIEAASAAPLIFDGTVELNGKRYMDAAALDPLPIDLPALIGAKKIVILTKGRAGLGKKLRYLLIASLYILLVLPFRRRRLHISKYVQYGLKPFRLNRMIDEVLEQEKRGNAVLIFPTKKLGGLLNNDPQTLMDTYDHGRMVALSKLDLINEMISSKVSN